MTAEFVLEQPYCEAQVGGMECGRPVEKWAHQCEKHDPEGAARRAARTMADQGVRPADDVLDDVEEKLASIRGDRDYDKGWRDALQWVLETATTHSDGGGACS